MLKDTAIGQQNVASPLGLGQYPTSGQLSSVPYPWYVPQVPMLGEGAKLDTGKVGVHLLPPDPLIQIAKVLDFGAKKYAAYNWTKGIKYSRVYGAALRHLWAWWKGEPCDSETGLSHLAHAGCCVLFLLQYEATRKEFDDRPIKEYADGPAVSVGG